MKEIKSFILKNIVAFPFVLLYLFLFIYSNDFAPDRDVYIYQIMSNPFEGREEPALHFLSYFFSFIPDAEIKLNVIHTLFLLIFLFTLSRATGSHNIIGISKYLFGFLFFIGAFSNQFGIQLRIGYASIIFCYLVFVLELKPKIRNLPWFLIPCLMHMGTMFAVFCYYFFYAFNINKNKRFLFTMLFSLLVMSLLIIFIEPAMQLLGIPSYYLFYLDKDIDHGRAIPFSAIFYILGCMFLYYLHSLDVFNSDFKYLFSFSGGILLYAGWVLGFYLSFKFLVPISFYLYIYLLSKVNLSITCSRNLLFISIPFAFFTYYYYCLQTGFLN